MSDTLPNSGSRTIGLFGGAFDPIHIGHQHVAETIVSKRILDEVWFVPVFQHPWAAKLGKSAISDYQDRRAMVNLTLEETKEREPRSGERIKLAEFQDVSYAYTTLTFFAKRFPGITFSWVMGSEYLKRFPEFLELHPKLTDFQFCIYPREGFPLEPLTSNMVALHDVEHVTVSSTQVRGMVAEGRSADSLVVPSVAQYIRSHGLYLKREL